MKALARMYQYIQRNYGKTWLSESEEKSRNYQLCRGIHSDCSLYYTEGVLKNPVGKYYQFSYAQKQKDKNLHAYYDQHRAVRQNISLLYQELKKRCCCRRISRLRMQTTEFYSPRGCGRWDGARMRICSGWSSGGIRWILSWIFS